MCSIALAHARQIEPLQTTRQATNRSDPLNTSTSRKTTVLFRTLDVADSRPLDSGYSTRLPDSLQQAATQQADSSLYLHRGRGKLITVEVGELLHKQAISRAVSDDGFISNIFLLPKVKGKWRLILNFKALNVYTEHQHFKMEDIRCVKDLLNRGDYMCKLDLKDAYLSVPIAQCHRKYLKFAWQGTVYQYNVLPFGLATAPRAFTKLMKPALAHLRSKGVRLIAYLDDLLIIGKDKREAEEAYQNAKSLLESLGFVINLEKSQAIGTQKMEFLGFIIDSVSMTLRLLQDKVKDVRQKCRCALQDPRLTMRELAHLIGTLVATRLAVTPAPLHYRSLQALKIRELFHHPSYESKVFLERQSQMDLEWWVNHLEDHNGSPIHLPPPEMIIESDASNTGWGAHWNNQKTGGQWSVVSPGVPAPYQCLRASSSILVSSDFCQRQNWNTCSFETRQSNGSVLHQQDGWHSFQGVDGNYSSSMGMEHTQEHNDPSRAPSRQAEHNGRPRVSIERRQLGVDSRSSSVSSDHGSSWSMSNRPICIEVISTIPEIHELETRPRFNCYGCIEPTLDGDQRVCLPTVFPDWEVPLQGQEGESVRADSSGSCLANTTMVCSPAIDVVPKTNHSSEVPIPVE